MKYEASGLARMSVWLRRSASCLGSIQFSQQDTPPLPCWRERRPSRARSASSTRWAILPRRTPTCLAIRCRFFGNVALVGVQEDDTGAAGAGAAYLFDAVSGSPLHTLLNPVPQAGERFGGSVSVSGNIALIGASGHNTGATNSGAAYLFDVTTGGLLRKLNNPAPNSFDLFGESVSVYGNLALVGAPSDDTGARNTGAAYLFDVPSGGLLRTLQMPGLQDSGFFGSSVSIFGDMALIGAPGSDTGADSAGSAYLFDMTTGGLLRTFHNPFPGFGDGFGDAVSLSDNVAMVGAPQDDNGAANTGSAYLFDVTTGGLLHALTDPTPEATGLFGMSVAVSGNMALVGSIIDDGAGTDSGSAYVFDVMTGDLLQTLNHPAPEAGDRFGAAVAVSGNVAVVSATQDDAGAADSGAAFLFLSPVNWESPVSGSWDDAGNWLAGADPALFSVITDAVIAPSTSLTVAGPAGLATVSTVTIGGGTGGITTLSLNDGTIAADDGVTVESNGALNGTGTIVGDVTNQGSVGGYVAIDGFLTNHTGGLMKVGNGERFRADTLLNLGEIRNTGSELQISHGLFNQTSGNMFGLNAVFDFGSLGAANAGSMGFGGGFNTVAGDVLNVAGGKIINSGNGTLIFYDDVTNDGELRTSGNGSTVIFGDYTGAGSLTGTGSLFLEGDFSPGSSPALVQATVNIDLSNAGTTTMELEGLLRGVQYDALDTTQTLTLGGDLEIIYLGGFEAALGDTFLLFTAAEILGGFDSIVFAAPKWGQWVVHQTATIISVSVAPVPVPAMACPFAGLALATGWLARRRNRPAR